MSIFATAYPAKLAKTKESQRVAWGYAVVLLIMAVFQLVSFSQFVLVIDSYWLPGGMQLAAFLAGFLIAAELLTVAFLVRVRSSPAFRVFTMVLGWLVPLIWFLLTIRIFLTPNELRNVGFLGGVVPLVPGWWAVFASIALAILAAWATWGLWPFPFKVTKRKK